MDLLARYLQAVRFFLPRGSQDDIVRELEEELRAQMEDRESQLGRTLTDEERSRDPEAARAPDARGGAVSRHTSGSSARRSSRCTRSC